MLVGIPQCEWSCIVDVAGSISLFYFPPRLSLKDLNLVWPTRI